MSIIILVSLVVALKVMAKTNTQRLVEHFRISAMFAFSAQHTKL